MEPYKKHQQQLLEQSQQQFKETPISDTTAAAFLATPRHHYVKRYRDWGVQEWQTVTADNLGQHLAKLYANNSVILFGDDNNSVPSTISQPGFVMHMLDLLQLEPGHTVFELGAGSGWNAALMGKLVGEQGQVYSAEIIPELAQTAQAIIEEQEIPNVRIIAGDGGNGFAAGAPYDRAIFTAGTYDLPRHFYNQIKDNGLLLIVIKIAGGGDTLFLLRKKGDHFEAEHALMCQFVALTGGYEVAGLKPMMLEALPDWHTLEQLSSVPFWWGGKGNRLLMWRTHGFRSYLGVTEPLFRTFKHTQDGGDSHLNQYFGLWDETARSLVIARDDKLTAYGDMTMQERLLTHLRSWVDSGMPSPLSLNLRIYPADTSLTVANKQWLVERTESQFLWSIDPF